MRRPEPVHSPRASLRVALAFVIALLVAGTTHEALAADPCSEGTACTAARGRVRRAGDRTPLSSARVLVVPEPSARKPGELPARLHLREQDEPAWLLAAQTDADGNYALPAVPAGRVRIVVLADGFERHERIELVRPGRAVTTVFLRPLEGNPYRTVVNQSAPATTAAEPVTGRALEREEIATMPGTQGDPLRAVQSLPGVGRSPGGVGFLVLRGASPTQSRVFYGEHPIPRAFHVLGFTSVMQADVIDSLEVQPSTFAVRYGNATGGVVLLQPRRGRRDGVHGHGKVDLISASAHVEGKLGRGTFLVGGQRGYVDAVLRVAEKVDPTAVFALPRYFDYQAQYDLPLRSGADFTARVIGSGDRWQGRYLDEFGSRGQAYTLGDHFHRAELVHRHSFGRWRTLVSPAFRFDVANAGFETFRSYRRTYVTSWRAEIERRIGEHVSITLGNDLVVAPFTSRRRISDGSIGGSATIRELRGVETTLGLYGHMTLELGELTLWPGVRVAGYHRRAPEDTGVRQHGAWSVDPRLLARWRIGRRWVLRGGVGRYSQADPLSFSGSTGLLDSTLGLSQNVALPAVLAEALDPGIGLDDLDDIVNVWMAVHANLGVSWTSRFGLGVDANVFTRRLLTSQSLVFARGDPGPTILDTRESKTVTLGGELLVRQRISDKLYAWVGYTVMRSDVLAVSRLRGGRPSDYDQRHNLVVLASYALPRRFRLGARFRLVSGSPYTPVVGAIATEVGYFGLPGGTNAARFPVFHQLDVRLDKTWIRKRTTWSAYVDVQNVYNHENTEALVYARDFRSVVGNLGLPIFPSLGVRFDW